MKTEAHPKVAAFQAQVKDVVADGFLSLADQTALKDSFKQFLDGNPGLWTRLTTSKAERQALSKDVVLAWMRTAGFGNLATLLEKDYSMQGWYQMVDGKKLHNMIGVKGGDISNDVIQRMDPSYVSPEQRAARVRTESEAVLRRLEKLNRDIPAHSNMAPNGFVKVANAEGKELSVTEAMKALEAGAPLTLTRMQKPENEVWADVGRPTTVSSFAELNAWWSLEGEQFRNRTI